MMLMLWRYCTVRFQVVLGSTLCGDVEGQQLFFIGLIIQDETIFGDQWSLLAYWCHFVIGINIWLSLCEQLGDGILCFATFLNIATNTIKSFISSKVTM